MSRAELIVNILFWGSLVILNMTATLLVLRTFFLVTIRRYYQIAFIWLVPFLGSFMVFYFNYEEWFNKAPKDEIGNNPNVSNGDAIIYAAGSDYSGSR